MGVQQEPEPQDGSEQNECRHGGAGLRKERSVGSHHSQVGLGLP